MRPRILVPQPIHADGIRILEEVGDVEVVQTDRMLSRDELKAALQRCDYLLAVGDLPLDGDILDANPDLRGILVDLPAMLDRAQPALRNGPLAARCTLQPGDLFGDLPAADAYILAQVLHNWDDDHASRILSGLLDLRRLQRAGGDLEDVATQLRVVDALDLGVGFDGEDARL